MQDAELQQLEQQLSLQSFLELDEVRRLIPPHDLEHDCHRFASRTTQFVFEVFQAGQGPDGTRVVGQQLYAGIKESSKYFSQVRLSKELGWPYPFPVRLAPEKEGYVVKGGIGGQYRLEDVALYVIEDGEAKAVLQ